MAVLNAVRYGSPLASGYGGTDVLFSMAHVAPNLDRYSRWLVETHTPFVALALLAPVWMWRDGARARWAVAGGAAVILTAATYLAYTVFDDWWYIRFLLPALPVLLVLACVGWRCVASAFRWKIPRAWRRRSCALVLGGVVPPRRARAPRVRAAETRVAVRDRRALRGARASAQRGGDRGAAERERAVSRRPRDARVGCDCAGCARSARSTGCARTATCPSSCSRTPRSRVSAQRFASQGGGRTRLAAVGGDQRAGESAPLRSGRARRLSTRRAGGDHLVR